MDHHELLGTLRRVSLACNNTYAKRVGTNPEWSWELTPIVFPESLCPFCKKAIRSNGIWFFRGPRQEQLIGALFPTQGGTAKLIQPSHPHDTGGGFLCLGRNLTGAALLASMPNMQDIPIGSHRVATWIAKYWQHKCAEGEKYQVGACAGYSQELINYRSVTVTAGLPIDPVGTQVNMQAPENESEDNE